MDEASGDGWHFGIVGYSSLYSLMPSLFSRQNYVRFILIGVYRVNGVEKVERRYILVGNLVLSLFPDTIDENTSS
jgi:hypothetical protein